MKYCMILLLLASPAYAGDCCYVQAPKINNKVEVITRLVGFAQPTKSKYSIDEQFELQKQLDKTLEPFLSQGPQQLPPLRRFTFQKNTPDYTPRRPVQQAGPQSVTQSQFYQQSTQFYTGVVEVPVTIQNGTVTIPQPTVNAQSVLSVQTVTQ